MKKLISLLLLAAMLLASCGSETGDETTVPSGSDETTAESAQTDRLDELGARDFGKRKFLILDAHDYPQNTMNRPRDDRQGDVLNDAVYARDIRISERYNCTIEYLLTENGRSGCEALARNYLAGDYYCDIISSTVSDSGTLRSLMAQSMLTDLNSIEYLSFDKPWWSQLINQNLTLGGRAFFAAGDILADMYTSPSILVANLKLLEQYTPEVDIYELVSDGKWTIDEMLGYSKFNNDLDGDNKLHTLNDFFGYIGDSTGYMLSTNSFLVGCGINITKADGDKLSMNLMNDRVIEVIDKVAQLVPHESMDDRSDYIVHTFKEDRAIFTQTYMGDVKNNLRSMESDYIILPFPKYDENQDTYRNLVNGWSSCFMAIPDNTNVDEVGFFAEALCYDAYVNVRPAVYDNLLKTKLARDERSTNMIDIIYAGLYIDFGAICNFGGTNSALSDAVYKGAALASGLASKQSAADKAIEEFTASWMAE